MCLYTHLSILSNFSLQEAKVIYNKWVSMSETGRRLSHYRGFHPPPQYIGLIWTFSLLHPNFSGFINFGLQKIYKKNTIKFLLFAKSKLLRLFLGQSEILDLALWLNRVLVNYLNRNAFFIYKIQVKYIDSHVLLICYVLLCNVHGFVVFYPNG